MCRPKQHDFHNVIRNIAFKVQPAIKNCTVFSFRWERQDRQDPADVIGW
jgi:hypothetical protein